MSSGTERRNTGVLGESGGLKNLFCIMPYICRVYLVSEKKEKPYFLFVSLFQRIYGQCQIELDL